MENNIGKKAKKVINALKQTVIPSDPQGQYTGRPDDENEKPVQDQDDM
jgi:hypothetical protein